MYSSRPLASQKNTYMAGSTTAPNTNQWTLEEQSLFIKKKKTNAATNGVCVTSSDHTCPCAA